MNRGYVLAGSGTAMLNRKAASYGGATVPLILLIGLGAVGWAGYSVVTGKGYYKGCPPGGFDRTEDPFSFWAPTIIIFLVGMLAILISLGMIPTHPRQ